MVEKTYVHGWGYFSTEADLLAAIDEEIGVQEARPAQPAAGDLEAAAWLVEHLGYSTAQVAETLGISIRQARRIMRMLGEYDTEED